MFEHLRAASGRLFWLRCPELRASGSQERRLKPAARSLARVCDTFASRITEHSSLNCERPAKHSAPVHEGDLTIDRNLYDLDSGYSA